MQEKRRDVHVLFLGGSKLLPPGHRLANEHVADLQAYGNHAMIARDRSLLCLAQYQEKEHH
jgi:hypothetical protein